MKTIHHQNGLVQVNLEPGEHYATNQRVMLSTLLGSCVSACLYDPVNRVIGMNHFLLSTQKNLKNGNVVTSEAGRYGINAMELVINKMIELGASREQIKAKAFGGGNVLQAGGNREPLFDIGEVNKRFIINFLKTENIPLVSSDLGGNQGRVIRFYGTDFAVYVRKIKKVNATNLLTRDKQYYMKKIDENKKRKADVELW